MDVTIHAIRYFVAVSEERHFGRAAARLHLAAPSLSEQIARLEQKLGTTLFERTPRGVEPTEHGVELLPLAMRLMRAHDDLLLWAARCSMTGEGEVRVGVFGAAAAPVRAQVLETMAERHRDVLVQTRRMGLADLVGALRAEQIDVAFAPGPLPRDRRGLRARTVSTQQRVLVVHEDHPLAQRDAVHVDDTNDEVFVTVAGGDPAAVDWWLVDPRPDGSHPSRGPVARDFDEVLDLCAARRGVNIASSFVVHHFARPGVVFVPLLDVEPARTLVMWRADERDAAVLAYLAEVQQVAGPSVGPEEDRVDMGALRISGGANASRPPAP